MALKDDPKVQELIAKAEARATKAETKRINGILADATAAAGDLEDPKHKKAVKAALSDVKKAIRETA